MIAKLPKELMEKTIGTMFPGETLYTVPWALVVDYECNCYLRTNYAVRNVPGGTVQMEVHRNAHGYNVTIPSGQLYIPCDIEHMGFEYAPVSRLV